MAVIVASVWFWDGVGVGGRMESKDREVNNEPAVVASPQLFGNIALDEEGEPAINGHNNFQTFIQALMLLFR